MTNVWVFYHGNCADGFGAAWAANKVIPSAAFVPCTYQVMHEQYNYVAPGDTVYSVDFMPPEAVLSMWLDNDIEVVILDHHKSAIEKLEASGLMGHPGLSTVLDVERSGAMITWEYFHNDPAPLLIQYVQDRDLWKFELSSSREVSAWIFSHEYDFDVWDQMVDMLKTIPARVIAEGSAIVRKQRKDIAEFLNKDDNIRWVKGISPNGLVPCVNLPYFYASDALHELLKRYPNAPCAASYTYTEAKVKFSLRSENERDDVSKIAMQHGGGGHRNAAGFDVGDDGGEGIFRYDCSEDIWWMTWAWKRQGT